MEGTGMLQNISILPQARLKKVIRTAAFILLALFWGTSFISTFAQQPGQQTFASVEDAGRAFFAAMKAPDDRSLLRILGPAGNDVISSGDPAEDLDARTNFTTKYDEMHRF